MKILNLFNRPVETATIPLTRFLDAVWQNPAAYERDDSITAHVLTTLGVSNLNHLRSHTFKFLATPDEHIVEVPGSLIEHPRTLCGSAGVFLYAYSTLTGKRGAAVLIRDKIESLDHFNFGHHLLLAFAGVAEPEKNQFHVNRLMTGTFGRHEQLNGQETLAINEKNAYFIMDYAKSCMTQMLEHAPLTASRNQMEARHKIRFHAPEMLDKPGLNP
jgi:hypothetical protein